MRFRFSSMRTIFLARSGASSDLLKANLAATCFAGAPAVTLGEQRAAVERIDQQAVRHTLADVGARTRNVQES